MSIFLDRTSLLATAVHESCLENIIETQRNTTHVFSSTCGYKWLCLEDLLWIKAQSNPAPEVLYSCGVLLRLLVDD